MQRSPAPALAGRACHDYTSRVWDDLTSYHDSDSSLSSRIELSTHLYTTFRGKTWPAVVIPLLSTSTDTMPSQNDAGRPTHLAGGIVTLRQCAHCRGSGGDQFTLKTCTRCRSRLYCSKECQKAEWPTHK